MKRGFFFAFAMVTVAGCNQPPAAPEASPTESDASDMTQQEEAAKQKLTIEQAAEEATKLIEAEAKAEIDAAMPVTQEPAQ